MGRVTLENGPPAATPDRFLFAKREPGQKGDRRAVVSPFRGPSRMAAWWC